MATVTITDQVHFSASVEVSDDSPLALAKLKNLNFASLPIVADFAKPIDQFSLDQVSLGVGLTSPAALIGNSAAVAVGGGINATFSLLTAKQKALFPEDEFAPTLAIRQGECWGGLRVNVTLQESFSAASPNGLGISLNNGSDLALSTFLHFPIAGSSMPTFKDGFCALLEKYSVPSNAEQLRAVPPGIAHSTETSGHVSLGAFYALPLSVNPLATANLPFNLTLNLAPQIATQIEGSVTLEGAFAVRTFRTSESKLVIGLYKKQGTILTASLGASAGMGVFKPTPDATPAQIASASNVGAEVGMTDLLGKVLGAVIPAANVNDLGLDEAEKKDLNAGLKACANQSLSLAINACCTASNTDEGAVIYEIDLSVADLRETDSALTAALRGNWSQLETLPNAHALRHVMRDLQERQHKLSINLLGLYNAISIADYVKSTAVMQDESGQISIVDKVAAKTLSAGTTPYAAKADKLRSLLASAFVATITYGACTGKIGITSFSVRQTFLDYHAQASAADLTRQILLARVFGFALSPELEAIQKSHAAFSHNKFYVEAVYDLACVYRFFYQDVNSYTPYSKETLDRIGRTARIDLLDSTATNSMQRKAALSNDETWNAMNETGNVSSFKFIPGLARLAPTAIAAISADWVDIRWWSDTLQTLAPRLAAVFSAIGQSKTADPPSDPGFMAARKNLENALENLSKNTHSAFGDGWPLAVMYRLGSSASCPSVEMDMSINGKFQHETGGPPIAKTQSSTG
jgi:hypothetical protein